MGATVITGTATDIVLGSDITYAATNNGPVAMQNQLVTLRIDGKPVSFRTRQSVPSISEGDKVGGAGKLKNGTLEAVALRNFTTGASYHPATLWVMVMAAILVVIGFPLIPILFIGLFFIGFGVWFFWKAWNVRQAIQALAALPAA